LAKLLELVPKTACFCLHFVDLMPAQAQSVHLVVAAVVEVAGLHQLTEAQSLNS